MEYCLLDSGAGQKLEKFGPYLLIRPSAVAIWDRSTDHFWQQAHALYSRDPNVKWAIKKPMTKEWAIELKKIRLQLKLTEFGHLGVFPEHAFYWNWMEALLKKREKPRVLNLFAHSGGATCAALRAGAQVTHVDAAKGMITWAKHNATLNGFANLPVRWIVEDVMKYVSRLVKKGEVFDGIILDPPSFGRGPAGEVFKIEKDLMPLLKFCKTLLSPCPLFFLFTSHSAGFTPRVLSQLMAPLQLNGKVECDELLVAPTPFENFKSPNELPSGSYYRWEYA